MELQAETAEIKTPEMIGHAFVSQFYSTLHHTPELVHRFFQDVSTMSRPARDGSLTIVRTIKDIDELMCSLDCKDCKSEILTVDAQASHKDGLMVLVTGCLLEKDNLRRKFTESFFLAPQSNSYYVLNDVFRFIADDELEAATSVEVKESDENVKAPTLAKEPELVEVTDKSLPDVSAAVEPVSNGNVDVCSKPDEQLTVKKPVVAEPRDELVNRIDDQVVVEQEKGFSIYIGNLPYYTTVGQVEEAFKNFGPIKHGGIQIRCSEGVCFSFVEYESLSSVQKAIEASVLIGEYEAVIDRKNTIFRFIADDELQAATLAKEPVEVKESDENVKAPTLAKEPELVEVTEKSLPDVFTAVEPVSNGNVHVFSKPDEQLSVKELVAAEPPIELVNRIDDQVVVEQELVEVTEKSLPDVFIAVEPVSNGNVHVCSKPDEQLTVKELVVAEPPVELVNRIDDQVVVEQEKGFSIYIWNLPYYATVGIVEEVFKNFGPIKHGGIQVRCSEGVCFAFVEYESLSSVQKAIGASVLIGEYKAVIERMNTSTGVMAGKGEGPAIRIDNDGFTDSERLMKDAAKDYVAMNPTNIDFEADRLFGMLERCRRQISQGPT